MAQRWWRQLALAIGGMALLMLLARPPAGGASTVPLGSRIPWQGGAWYLSGANVPWLNWGCDFGCGAEKGVSSPAANADLDATFRAAAQSGVRVLRWWMFEGDAAQIGRDGGAPGTLNPTVYTDIDAAVRLAETYDLYYIFTLFSSPDALPDAWLSEPEQRAKLGAALRPLFARYAGNPRILAWDIFNEPEWSIWNGRAHMGATQALVKLLADEIHANSTAYATLTSATLEGLPMWIGLGLDFYAANWYDPIASGDGCALCTDYAAVRARYNLDAPLVIGEFYAGPEINARERLRAWYDKGYAGALAWSLNWDATADKLKVDLPAFADLSGSLPEVGPRAGPAR